MPLLRSALKVLNGSEDWCEALALRLALFHPQEAPDFCEQLRGLDPAPGPEMKSTGEAIGFDSKLGSAFAKAEFSAGSYLPIKGTVFISVNDNDKMKSRIMSQSEIEIKDKK